MRLTRYQLFALGVLILAVAGTVAFTQPEPRGGGRRGGRGGFRGPDPEETFKQFSGGKDVLVVSEVQVPERMARFVSTDQLRERMNAYLQKKGITNGQMTLEQYKDYSEEARREMMEKFRAGGFGKFGKGPPAGGAAPPGSGSAPPGPPPSPADTEAQAREAFKRMDTDNDGKLSVEEMKASRQSRIYDERDKYDANKNGTIEFDEYLKYYKDRMAQRGGWGGQAPAPGPPPEEEKKRVVYRVGKLPKELKAAAPWFEQLDKDKDGQVGLYEWKAAGKPTKEFVAMDSNGDGFVTVEEALRFHKGTKKGTDATSVVASAADAPAGPASAAAERGGRGSRGGRGGRFRGSWGGAAGR